MQLHNTFEVPGQPDEVFELLLDLEQVAMCMPGATLTDSDGDSCRGQLRLKVGAITAAYEGEITITDVDHDARTAKLEAKGGEQSGQGRASASVSASVTESDGGSEVTVDTELDIEGRAAQFGRGALDTVAQRVVDQFARNLEARMVGPDDAAAVSDDVERTDGAARQTAAAAGGDALDVLSLSGVSDLPTGVWYAAIFVIGVLVGVLARGGRCRYGSPSVVVVTPGGTVGGAR